MNTMQFICALGLLALSWLIGLIFFDKLIIQAFKLPEYSLAPGIIYMALTLIAGLIFGGRLGP